MNNKSSARAKIFEFMLTFAQPFISDIILRSGLCEANKQDKYMFIYDYRVKSWR